MGFGAIVASASFALMGSLLAWSLPWRARQLVPVDVAPLATRLRSQRFSERADAILACAPADSWERELCQALREEEDDGQRLLLVNSQVSWLDHQLSLRQRWPRVGALVVLAGGLLVAAAGSIGGAATVDLLWGGAAALAGVVGCVLAQVVGRRQVVRARVRIDDFLSTLAGELDNADLGQSAPRLRRRYRRRAAAAASGQTRGPGTPFGMA